MAEQQAPIIFLAFANDLVDEKAFLRGLKKEREGIREALKVAEKAELCELIIEPNTSIHNIIDTFQEYGDRIAVFHYAGHSNSFQLLLETLEGEHASAHSEGLISFLSKQHALKLIFLNGCSSGKQALGLVEAGIEAVIGTSNSINDDIANLLAVRFYKGLAHGKSIEAAWEEAVDEVKIKKGTANVRDLLWDGQELETAATESKEPIFPWSIHYKNKAKVAGWNLPKAANNHLFGLPPIPDMPLPVNPFPNTEPYTADYAEVFFGRTRYIREMHELITSPNTPPIILVKGQSGVGKTSLIEAGVLPRLEESHCIRVIQEMGEEGYRAEIEQALEDLVNSFIDDETDELPSLAETNDKTAFIQQLQQLSEDNPEYENELFSLIEQARAQQSEQLGATDMGSVDGKWHYVEARLKRPMIMVIDHLEELILLSPETASGDLDDLCDLLRQLFVIGDCSLKGKVVISVRDDYSKDIEKYLHQASLPFTKLHIDRFTQEEITEIVEGLTTSERLKSNYQLEVAPKFPVLIADDVLADEESAVSLVLQIVLAKMWQNTQEEKVPIFSEESYKQATDKGLHLSDYYDDQLKKLVEFDEDLHWIVEYGLILDILFQFTANQRQATAQRLDEIVRFLLGEINIEDKDDKEAVEGVEFLVNYLIQMGFLISLDKETKRLAHNDLALVICNRYRHSTQLVQRANRMLNYKVMEHQLNPEILFNQAELDMFAELEDKTPFRVLNENENALIDKSLDHLDNEEDEMIDLAWGIYDTVGYMRFILEHHFLDYLQQQTMMHPEYEATFFTYITQEIFENSHQHEENILTHEEKFCVLAFAYAKTHPATLIEDEDDRDEYYAILESQGEIEALKELAETGEESFVKGTLYTGIDEESERSYELEVTTSTQFSIADMATSETITIDTEVICSIDIVGGQFPLICTRNGLVSLWNHKGQKLIELGATDPDHEQYYWAAAYDYDAHCIILQSSAGIEVYPLFLDAIIEESEDIVELPDHIEKRIQEQLNAIAELMEMQKEHEEAHAEEYDEEEGSDEDYDSEGEDYEEEDDY